MLKYRAQCFIIDIIMDMIYQALQCGQESSGGARA